MNDTADTLGIHHNEWRMREFFRLSNCKITCPVPEIYRNFRQALLTPSFFASFRPCHKLKILFEIDIDAPILGLEWSLW